ncbi:hypothetical protein FOZ70_18210 [Burkholderia sp. COPS]|uniref:PIN-like domain-containing protein n=1 Tax=Burkholderia TaxID=32008 RepID=UPI000A8E1CDC|nr:MULTISPECIES: PIN domain-containing protein [Burkholderia]MBW5806670.1 hypothetical protein [Burkholderia sp. COPS]
MKNEFIWYFHPDEAEIKGIWGKGLLTLDANVLLDLYRYHENTRNSILRSLRSFKGRLWLSNQTAEEFFRNRAKVIVGSSNGFRQASDELEKIRKSHAANIEQLKNNRIISAELIEKLESALSTAIDQAGKDIEVAREAFPNYLDKDPILEDLIALFEGAVGKPFSEDELKVARAEGERRKKNQIAPGYLDDEKDGDRPYGDYFMWRQILTHAKASATPMILVTSERKEDWWERPSGRTVGPRQDLLRDAHENAEQRILIYQTDRFLQFAAELTGGKADESAVEEIRAVDSLRTAANAVRVTSQSLSQNSQTVNSGRLVIELLKPLFRFTASGHFDPQLISVPNLRVGLIDSPSELPRYRIGAGTGTTHDFNVHLKSEVYGAPLPAGTYIFEYTASCVQSNELSGSGGTI